MKKNLILLLLASQLLLSCTSTSENIKQTQQRLEQFFLDANIENINKAVIQDGATGDSKTITDQEQIKEFITLIKDIEFTSQMNQEGSVGWRYGITLFDGEKKFKFTLNQLENTYYNSNPDIYPIVDKFYKQLSEPTHESAYSTHQNTELETNNAEYNSNEFSQLHSIQPIYLDETQYQGDELEIVQLLNLYMKTTYENDMETHYTLLANPLVI